MGNSTYKGFESAADLAKRLGNSAIIIFRNPKVSSAGSPPKLALPDSGKASTPPKPRRGRRQGK